MDIVMWVVLAAFVIFAAVMAMRQGKQNRGKSYAQRREETYRRYEQRMEEFRQTEKDQEESSEK